ncbi:MFS transporter [Desulfitobacterium sp.]|uniref:MFS transporter n=1 Tax=Desulfitobacterium sp. TaxID=49981 RepID=UPI002CB02F42|nr:MFS transporter [Desulfitobacterium sp.]HVJ49900.1 MFS transporter [Desulfitobacterium sp.]
MFSFRNLIRPYQGMPKEIYVIFVARIINALGCFVMPLMTIILTQSIGLSKEMAGFYISLTGLLYLPAALLGGKLADHFGRKRVILFFNGLAIGLYLLAGSMKPSLDLVYVLMFAGASMTASGPAHDSLIADLTNPKNRAGAYALSYLGWNMGFAVGPVIGGILYQHHLPWVFIGDASTALIALLLIGIFIPETIHKAQVEVIEETRKWERREEGSIFSVLAKRPILLYFSFIMFGYNFAYSQWSFMLPIQTLQLFPQTGAQYFGYLAGFNGLVVMLFTPIVTKLAEKTPLMRRMVYGGLFYALGFGMLGVLNSLFFIFLWAFTFTLGEIILAISVTPFIANHTPASHRGRMSAIVPTLFNLGHTLGPFGMGKALNYVSLETGWKGIGVSTLIFAMLMGGLEFYERRNLRAEINPEVESI